MGDFIVRKNIANKIMPTIDVCNERGTDLLSFNKNKLLIRSTSRKIQFETTDSQMVPLDVDEMSIGGLSLSVNKNAKKFSGQQ